MSKSRAQPKLAPVMHWNSVIIKKTHHFIVNRIGPSAQPKFEAPVSNSLAFEICPQGTKGRGSPFRPLLHS